jgi:hypothetical protein
MLLVILPEKGNEITIPIIKKLKADLIFTSEELTEIGFQQKWTCPNCNGSHWLEEIKANTDLANGNDVYCNCGKVLTPTSDIRWIGQTSKDVIIDPQAKEILLSTFKGMSNRDELTEPYYDLYMRFKEE